MLAAAIGPRQNKLEATRFSGQSPRAYERQIAPDANKAVDRKIRSL
jgi:hypothetical protein